MKTEKELIRITEEELKKLGLDRWSLNAINGNINAVPWRLLLIGFLYGRFGKVEPGWCCFVEFETGDLVFSNDMNMTSGEVLSLVRD